MLKIENLNNDILHDISLSAHANKITAVMGHNGAGKSYLLRSLMGLHKTSGKAYFGGENLLSLPLESRAKLGIGYVPQGKRLFADMSVADNIKIGAKIGGESVYEYIWELFPLLKSRYKQISGTLSGGEQQMLAIARSLALQPKLLLLDEPSEGLQPSFVDSLKETLTKLKNKMTILLVEQNAELAMQADEVYFIKQGRNDENYQKLTTAIYKKHLGF